MLNLHLKLHIPPAPQLAPLRKNKEALYKFSKVFPEDSGQQAIYAGVAEPLVADLLGAQQPEAVIMAYGVTSAGKTFTMQVKVFKRSLRGVW